MEETENVKRCDFKIAQYITLMTPKGLRNTYILDTGNMIMEDLGRNDCMKMG